MPSTTGICSKVIRTAKPLRIRGARRSYRVKNTLTRLVIFNLPPRHVHRPGRGFVFAGHPMSLSRIRPRHTAPLPIPAGTPGREAMGTAADIIAGMVSTGGIDRRRAREILRNCPYALVLDDRSNRLVVVGREYQPLGIEQRCTAAGPDYRPYLASGLDPGEINADVLHWVTHQHPTRARIAGFFYDDSTAPWRGVANARRYLRLLETVLKPVQ